MLPASRFFMYPRKYQNTLVLMIVSFQSHHARVGANGFNLMIVFVGIDWALRLRKDMESSGHLSTCPWTRIPTPVDILTLPKGDTVELYLTDALASFKKLQKYINVDGMYLQMMVSKNICVNYLLMNRIG